MKHDCNLLSVTKSLKQSEIHQGKIKFGRLMKIWEDNTERNLREIVCEVRMDLTGSY
jgi:hypothetical protein